MNWLQSCIQDLPRQQCTLACMTCRRTRWWKSVAPLVGLKVPHYRWFEIATFPGKVKLLGSRKDPMQAIACA
eukprot:4062635-Amphidinium_carterae.3